MYRKEFKNTFNKIAHENGFEKAFGGWYELYRVQESILINTT